MLPAKEENIFSAPPVSRPITIPRGGLKEREGETEREREKDETAGELFALPSRHTPGCGARCSPQRVRRRRRMKRSVYTVCTEIYVQ